MSSSPVARPGQHPGPDARPTIEVAFLLTPDDGWPPFPAERVLAVLETPEAARIVGTPLFVDDVSVGDTVQVIRDTEGFTAGSVLSRGRHSTVRVVAATAAELEALRADLGQLAARIVASTVPPVLAIDVDDRTSIEDLLVRLDWACTANMTYAISCLQHRITDSVLDDHHAVPAVASYADSLDGLLRGRVVRPGDSEWDQARSAWNLAVDQRPLMVAEVSDAFDVQSVVRYAAEHGLRVAPQSTGHNARPLGDLSDAVLLRTGRMREVTVDAEQQSVRVGAGAIWEDVTAALAPHGLAALACSSPDVGVAGYALGGGYSWLGRGRGLAASSITAVELVTGDGLFHRVDADHERELFWAVRGGGANVGVVCAMELDVFPIPEVYGGSLLFPITRAAEVLPAYVEWTRDLPEVATTCVRLLRLPPLPELPEPLRGNAFVMIDGAIDADAVEAERLLAPLRALEPAIDTWDTMPTAGLAMIHLDPPAPVPADGDGLSLTDLTPEVIEVLLAHAGPDVESALLAVDVRHLGGALGRPDPRGGAVDHLDGGFALFAVGITPTPEAHAAVATNLAALIGALQPYAAPHDYLNFCERSVPSERIYPARELERMRTVRSGVDPRGVLAAAHPID